MSYEDRYRTDEDSLSIVDPEEWNEEDDDEADTDADDEHPCRVPKGERD